MNIKLNQDINWFIILNKINVKKQKTLINQLVILNKIQWLKKNWQKYRQLRKNLTQ